MKNKNRDIVESFSLVTQFGITMIVPIVMCVAFGVWIGGKFNMDWIVIPLFFIGALAGYNNIYRMSKKYLKNKDRRKDRKNNVKKN